MPWPAGRQDKHCVVEKNAVYYDKYIVLLNSSRAASHADCCLSCWSYKAPATTLGDDASAQHCNLWTW